MYKPGRRERPCECCTSNLNLRELSLVSDENVVAEARRLCPGHVVLVAFKTAPEVPVNLIWVGINRHEAAANVALAQRHGCADASSQDFSSDAIPLAVRLRGKPTHLQRGVRTNVLLQTSVWLRLRLIQWYRICRHREEGHQKPGVEDDPCASKMLVLIAESI